MSKSILFIGLGNMGGPMAGHLVTKGYKVYGFNRTASKALTWSRTYGGYYIEKPENIVSQVDAVITCVGNDDDLRSWARIIPLMKKGALFIDHTTASAQVAEELGVLADQYGVHFLDCPVSGGQAGAEKGILTTFVGGTVKALEKAQEFLQAYSKSIAHFGVAGFGQKAKMVNQLCFPGILLALSESIKLAESLELDVHKLMSVMSLGAAGSWQMANRAITMHERRFEGFGFHLDYMIKDLGICLTQAQSLGLALPLAEMVKAKYESLSQQGFGQNDTSALIRIYDQA